jgi:hypothetical protein
MKRTSFQRLFMRLVTHAVEMGGSVNPEFVNRKSINHVLKTLTVHTVIPASTGFVVGESLIQLNKKPVLIPTLTQFQKWSQRQN